MPEEINQTSGSAIHSELDAMRKVGEAIDSLADAEARQRVLLWVTAKFGISSAGGTGQKDSRPTAVAKTTPPIADDEIPGIARATPNGALEVTVRDLKAKNTPDAAIRLAHIVIYAAEKLRGERFVSSRKTLLPILKEWRAYDGNTRLALARHKGIHRDGDSMSLDTIAKKDAEKFIAEVLDETVQGTWNPSGRPTKRPSNKKAPTDQDQST